jgi:hypothetical protein
MIFAERGSRKKQETVQKRGSVADLTLKEEPRNEFTTINVTTRIISPSISQLPQPP